MDWVTDKSGGSYSKAAGYVLPAAALGPPLLLQSMNVSTSPGAHQMTVWSKVAGGNGLPGHAKPETNATKEDLLK